MQPRNAVRLPAHPRLLALGALICLSPLAMLGFQPWYDHVYAHPDIPAALHPALIVTVIMLGADFLRGFRWRPPACNWSSSSRFRSSRT